MTDVLAVAAAESARRRRPAARPVVAGHEAAHAIVALSLAVPVLRVDARPGDPCTYLAWPEYRPDLWGPVLIAGQTWEELAGWPPAEACQRDDLAMLLPLAVWCPVRVARARAAELLSEHAVRHAQLAAALRAVGQLSGPEVAGWWHRGRELPDSADDHGPGDSASHSARRAGRVVTRVTGWQDG